MQILIIIINNKIKVISGFKNRLSIRNYLLIIIQKKIFNNNNNKNYYLIVIVVPFLIKIKMNHLITQMNKLQKNNYIYIINHIIMLNNLNLTASLTMKMTYKMTVLVIWKIIHNNEANINFLIILLLILIIIRINKSIFTLMIKQIRIQTNMKISATVQKVYQKFKKLTLARVI